MTLDKRGIMNKKEFVKRIGIIIVMIFLGTRVAELFFFMGNQKDISAFLMEEILSEEFGKKINNMNASIEAMLLPNGIQRKKVYLEIIDKQDSISVSSDKLSRIQEENRKVEKELEEHWIEWEDGAIEEISQEKTEKIKQETREREKSKEKKPVKRNAMVEELKKNKSIEYLLEHFYIVDSTTCIDQSVFQVEKFLKRDFSIKKTKEPQILIYHTHGGSESFLDGTRGGESIVETGKYLAEILEEDYGYTVIHDETKYDIIDGKMDRSKAYTQALKKVSKILEENPSIKVIIDLHRDGVNSSQKRVTKIDGKDTAQFMIFNGLSRNRNGNIKYLYNPNLEGNLAFGLQIKLKAMELYPELTIRNYLKGYRYNMHLRERFLLIELGNENTTVEEARNTMPCLAKILEDVLKK